MKVTLTNEQKHELESEHDKTRDGRVRNHIKAVLLASEGWSTAMIFQALHIHETTVLRHLQDYEQSENLKPENYGSSNRLSASQTVTLIEYLSELTYHHTYQIVAYVQEQFGVQYTVSGMNKWLHHNGFSYKKPKGVPHKSDEAKQQDFVDAYETLKASCGKDESILFTDAVHPSQPTRALNISDIAGTIINDYESINSQNIASFIELLWKVVNERARNNVYFKSKRNFEAAINRFFTVTHPKITGSLASRINDNFQMPDPASSD